MTGREARQQLEAWMTARTEREMWALCIESLRRWRTKSRTLPPPQALYFDIHNNLAKQLVLLLAEKANAAPPDGGQISTLTNEFGGAQSEAWIRSVFEFAWWFTRAGYAVPLGTTNASFAFAYRLTPRGEHFLDRHDDHPLLPGYLDRLGQTCSGLPEAVIPILADANRALEHGLARAAVLLAGVAYEIAIAAIVDRLFDLNLASKSATNGDASEKVRAVREAIVKPQMKAILKRQEAREAATNACDFADRLRAERNRGAHTDTDFELHDAEEFLVSAGRQLPTLWAMTAEPA